MEDETMRDAWRGTAGIITHGPQLVCDIIDFGGASLRDEHCQTEAVLLVALRGKALIR
jgi:hypothetical protein